MTTNIEQLLGRIDGKLDQVIDSAKEHREDDKRRFTEVHGRLDEHAEAIHQAKGQKSVILWLAGGGLLSVGAAAAAVLKAFG